MRSLDNFFALDFAYYENELDHIFYMVSLLKDRPEDWFDGVNILIPKDATGAAGVHWNPNSVWLTWSHFRNARSDSYGNSLTSEKAVAEWESLAHKFGKSDKYLYNRGQLSFLTKYNYDVLKQKVIAGLHEELQIKWSKL
jgi:hypothetical protein